MRSWIGCLLVLVVAGCSGPKTEDMPAVAPAAPTTTIPASTGTPLDLAGVPTYPGATQAGSAVSPESAGATHFSVLLNTSDSVDKVVAYYKEKLGFQSSSKSEMTQLVGRTKQGADVLIFITPDQGQTQISVKGILYSKKQP
jgi:hypothetical protein